MMATNLKPGDWVIYRKQKFSTSPGPRAKNTNPASRGDTYSYIVDKFWVVEEILCDEQVRLRTRRGKQHIVEVTDPHLRRANLLERLMYRKRFRETTRDQPS